MQKQKSSKGYHFGITVYDLDKMVDFYTKGFGLIQQYDEIFKGEKLGKGLGIPNAKIRVVRLNIPNCSFFLELLKYIEPKEDNEEENKKNVKMTNGNTKGLNHISFEVENIEESFEKLEKLGMKFKGKPQDVGECKFCLGNDIEGNLLEIMEFK